MPPTPNVKNNPLGGSPPFSDLRAILFPSSLLPERSFIAYLHQVVPDRTAAWMAVPHIHQGVLQVRQAVAAILGSSGAVRLGREVGTASGHRAVVGRACQVGKGACCSGRQGMAASAVCLDRREGLHVDVSNAIQGETVVGDLRRPPGPMGPGGPPGMPNGGGGPPGGKGNGGGAPKPCPGWLCGSMGFACA